MDRDPVGAIWLIPWLGLVYLSIVLAHEAGHVIAYVLLGTTWDEVILGPTLAVSSSDARSNRAQLLISSSGPLLHMLAGMSCALLAPAPWSALWVIGVLGVIDGIGNALIPSQANSDARKLWITAWRTVRGRGSEMFG